ncbi:hypothetical protein [Kitasatospora cineracea]|uniref:hypothetical protein n=1 Tax=Kitasatospora cineracea TaxID=88074 RepID=UPI003686BFD3
MLCPVLCPVGHPLHRRTGVDLGRPADAGRLDAPAVAAPPADLRTATGGGAFPAVADCAGLDAAALLAPAAAGHGLAVLPRTPAASAGATALPVRAPRLAHRREVLFAPVLDVPARAFVDALPRRV